MTAFGSVRAEAEALSSGIASSAVLNGWRASLEQTDADGVFFASATMSLVGREHRVPERQAKQADDARR